MRATGSDYPPRSHRLPCFSFHAYLRLQKRTHFSSVEATSPLPLLVEFFHEMSEFGKNELFHREADGVF